MSDALTRLHLHSRLAELPTHGVSVSPQTLAQEVVQRMRRDEWLPGVLVIGDGRLAGVLSRRHLLETMARPYSLDLFLGRPVEALLDQMPATPLMLPADVPIAEAADHALGRSAELVYEPVAVAGDDGSLALVDVHLLLRAQSRILALANGEKDRLLGEKQAALDELRRAQDDLLKARKMAALGQVVAGVAHEINTPVGVGLTAASHLQEQAAEVQARFRDNRLKRSDLRRFLGLAEESAGLLYTNLQRAAELIQNFKQVAVDQSSQQRRCFPVRGYLKTILASLRPHLKKCSHQVELECPRELEMDSYPGPLWQIVTNLVTNSLIHAYGEGEQGRLRIAVQGEGERVRFDYSDDGGGIPPEHLERIFEPFFTTRRGRGGAGLGLHIVYNLVTHNLKGAIHCESPAEAGRGTRFRFELPRIAP